MANGYVAEMPYRWRRVVIEGLVEGWNFGRIREALGAAGMPEGHWPTDKSLRTFKERDDEYLEVCRHLRFHQAAALADGELAADSAALDAYAESLLLRETSLKVMDGSFSPEELCRGMNAVTRLSRTRFQRRVAEATCARQDRAEATAKKLGLTGGVLGGAMGGGRPLAGGRASGGMATREQLFAARTEGSAELWLEGTVVMMEGVMSAHAAGLARMSAEARRAVGVALLPLANMLACRGGAVRDAFPEETLASVEEPFEGMVKVIRTLSQTGELPAAAMGEPAAQAAEDGGENEDVEAAGWLARRETERAVRSALDDDADCDVDAADEADVDGDVDAADGAEAGEDAPPIGSLAWFQAGDDGEEDEDVLSLMTTWHRDARVGGERGDGGVVYRECKADEEGSDRGDDVDGGGPTALAEPGTAAVTDATDATSGVDDSRSGGGGGGGGAAPGERGEDGPQAPGRALWKVPPFLCGPNLGPGSDVLVLTDHPRYARSQDAPRAAKTATSATPATPAKGVRVGWAGPRSKADRSAPFTRQLSVEETAYLVEADRKARLSKPKDASLLEVCLGLPLGTEEEYLATLPPELKQVCPELYDLSMQLYHCVTNLFRGDLKANLARLLELVTAADMPYLFEPLAASVRRAGLSHMLPDSARFCPIMPDPNTPPPGVSQADWQAARAEACEGLEARARAREARWARAASRAGGREG